MFFRAISPQCVAIFSSLCLLLFCFERSPAPAPLDFLPAVGGPGMMFSLWVAAAQVCLLFVPWPPGFCGPIPRAHCARIWSTCEDHVLKCIFWRSDDNQPMCTKEQMWYGDSSASFSQHLSRGCLFKLLGFNPSNDSIHKYS